MSAPVPLLTVSEAVAAARIVADCANAGSDVRRAISGLSTSAIASIAILVEQLDRIAKGAADFSCRSNDMAAWETLQQQLLSAGYLPLPEQKEAIHGQG